MLDRNELYIEGILNSTILSLLKMTSKHNLKRLGNYLLHAIRWRLKNCSLLYIKIKYLAWKKHFKNSSTTKSYLDYVNTLR